MHPAQYIQRFETWCTCWVHTFQNRAPNYAGAGCTFNFEHCNNYNLTNISFFLEYRYIVIYESMVSLVSRRYMRSRGENGTESLVFFFSNVVVQWRCGLSCLFE